MIGPLAIGTPVEETSGTGVARYAATLRLAADALGASPLRIEVGAPIGKWRRRLSALRPGVRRAVRTSGEIALRDMFREAQVHFDIYRRPLEFDCDGLPGIVHWAYPVPVRLRGWVNIYTVHDAIPLTHPELTNIDARRHRRLLEALAWQGHFVTVSEAARQDIIGALRFPPEKIVDLGQAVDVAGIEPGSELPQGLAEGRYFLHCGTLEARKNIDRLIEAHDRSGTALPLVLAGPTGEARAFGPRAIHVGYLPRGALLRLIAGARAIVMPSLAEGFGLPVAEAMLLGTPVLTSDQGALAEVAGGAALTIDVTDVDAMAQEIATLARDDELCQSLAARGSERGRSFQLGAFADRLRHYYEMIGG